MDRCGTVPNPSNSIGGNGLIINHFGGANRHEAHQVGHWVWPFEQADFFEERNFGFDENNPRQHQNRSDERLPSDDFIRQ
ncbi:MAG: hypothetical protein GC192_11885 [Bacteroidetes bacterium]|nr:hypothetical protein [Bacteroidota bacterium]